MKRLILGLAFMTKASSSSNHVCENPTGEKDRNNFHFRGTALGGWYVIIILLSSWKPL
jgi:hypothetical protein